MEANEFMRRVREANRAWTEGRPGDVAPLFHPHVVIASPMGTAVAHGRDAMVASFVDFCERATTHRFEETDHEVHTFGDTALVSYGFSIDYELEGERYADRGREVLVFSRSRGEWAVVWRMQIPEPSGSGPE